MYIDVTGFNQEDSQTYFLEKRQRINNIFIFNKENKISQKQLSLSNYKLSKKVFIYF